MNSPATATTTASAAKLRSTRWFTATNSRGGKSLFVQRFGAKAFSVGTQVLARGIDRKDEHQADVHGMVIAARAGYDPFSLVGVLQTLDIGYLRVVLQTGERVTADDGMIGQ